MRINWFIISCIFNFGFSFQQNFCLGEAQKYAPAIEVKKQKMGELVERAATFFASQPTDKACLSFSNDVSWRQGDVELFLFDENKLIYFWDDNYKLTWTFMPDLKTVEGEDVFELLQKSDRALNELMFLWRRDLVLSHIRTVQKDGKRFFLGAVLFVESPFYKTQELIFKARLFLDEYGLASVVEEINNPEGQFVFGSLGVSLYEEGSKICLADSYDFTRVMEGMHHWVDDNGKNVFDQYIASIDLDKSTDYGWSTHTSKGMKVVTFLLRLFDKNTQKNYIFASSFYPEVDREYVVKFAQEAIDVLKNKGPNAAFPIITNPLGQFNRGHLYIAIYDEKGYVKAFSRNPSLIGANGNLWLDQTGFPSVKNMIDQVLHDGEAWVINYEYNAGVLSYGRKVTMPQETYIQAVRGYTPFDKKDIAHGIMGWATRVMVGFPEKYALSLFDKIAKGERVTAQRQIQDLFALDDFFIEVYDAEGFCISSGLDRRKLWEKMDSRLMNEISQAQTKGSNKVWFSSEANGITRYEYARVMTSKQNKKYYIVAGYEVPKLKEASHAKTKIKK